MAKHYCATETCFTMIKMDETYCNTRAPRRETYSTGSIDPLLLDFSYPLGSCDWQDGAIFTREEVTRCDP